MLRRTGCPKPCPVRLQDKILQSMGRGHSIMVTNDGATILKSLYVDNHAAKVLVGAPSLQTRQPSVWSRRIVLRGREARP